MGSEEMIWIEERGKVCREETDEKELDSNEGSNGSGDGVKRWGNDGWRGTNL